MTTILVDIMKGVRDGERAVEAGTTMVGRHKRQARDGGLS